MASKTAQKDLCQINAIMSDKLESTIETLEKMSKDHSQFQDHISKLHKEVHRRLHAPGQRAHAVEAAILKATNDFEAKPMPGGLNALMDKSKTGFATSAAS